MENQKILRSRTKVKSSSPVLVSCVIFEIKSISFHRANDRNGSFCFALSNPRISFEFLSRRVFVVASLLLTLSCIPAMELNQSACQSNIESVVVVVLTCINPSPSSRRSKFLCSRFYKS
jgi:hypothetical protein